MILKMEKDGVQRFDPPDYYDQAQGEKKNTGQDFFMRRTQLGRPFQKPYYKPGDEAFRYMTMRDDLEQIERRVNSMQYTAGTRDDEAKLAKIQKRL